MLLKEYIQSHVKAYAFILDIRCHLSSNTRKYFSLIKEMSNIDSIFDYSMFCKHMKSIKNNPSITAPRYDKYCRESLRNYGYYQAILKYAGSENISIPYIAFEHGIRFSSAHWTEYSEKPIHTISYACQGPGRYSEIHDLDPWKPVFIFGPYIHYVSSYYSDEKTMQIKNKLGKVLLVFPSHSWEFREKKTESSLFDIVYKKYANYYDTILVCAYWNDIDAPIIDLFVKKGATVVSAGFRNDPNFIRRLKTIISLADDVVVDDLGTNLGFCKHMNKPVYLECSSSRFPNDKYFTENFKRFHEAFFSHNRVFTEGQLLQQNKLYEFFWGGEKCLKTADEVKDIFDVLKEMSIESHYNINKMPEFIRKHCSGPNIERRYKLLADAVSPSVWQ